MVMGLVFWFVLARGAEKMIHVMGLTVRDEDNPDGDIEILYTGLRPAEKRSEELLIGNNVAGTVHRSIMHAESLMAATASQRAARAEVLG